MAAGRGHRRGGRRGRPRPVVPRRGLRRQRRPRRAGPHRRAPAVLMSTRPSRSSDRPLVAGLDLGGTKILGRRRSTRPTRRVALARQRVDTPAGRRRASSTPWPASSPQLASRGGPAGLGDARRGRRRGGRAGRPRRRAALRPEPARAWSTSTCAGRSAAAHRAARWSSTTTPTRRRWPSTASGPATGRDDMVLVTLGTGIGGGHRRRTACCSGARPASPASPATWWSTRTGRRARAAGAGAGSASPRAAGSVASPATRPTPAGPTASWPWPAATPSRCGAST